MVNHLLNLIAGDGEVSTGIEHLGLVVHDAADTGGHSETDIGVDIDLADCHLRCLTELLLRNTDSVRKLAADGVDLLDILLRNARSAVKNDREARKSLCDLFKNIKTKRRRNENAVSVPCALLRLELISAVGSTDSDSERVNTGTPRPLPDGCKTNQPRKP